MKCILINLKLLNQKKVNKKKSFTTYKIREVLAVEYLFGKCGRGSAKVIKNTLKISYLIYKT